MDYTALDLPRPAARQADADDVADVEARDVPRPRTHRESWTGPAVQARTEERHRVVARHRDGHTYAGSLVDDVVRYRELRTRRQRGDEQTPAELQRYEDLDEALREPEDDEGGDRAFHRFETSFPARLRFSDGSEVAAVVLDMGVDGAKLRAQGHQIGHDAIVWLAIHLVSRGRALTVVFTSRVMWTCRDHLGLGFAGAPGWERLDHRKVEIRTHMSLEEQVRAARATLARLKLRSRSPSDGL